MTVKTTLSFTDRHHRFLSEKVGEGVFATQSAAVATAIERLMQDEEEREVALSALAEDVRARMQTARSEYVDRERAFSAARAVVGALRHTENERAARLARRLEAGGPGSEGDGS